MQRSQKVLRQSLKHSAATTTPPDDARQTSTPTAPLAANVVSLPTPTIGSAAASKATKRRRSVVAEQVFDRIAVAPDHRSDSAAANADRVAQLQSLAARHPDLFTAATGAAKIDSHKLSPSLQLTLINLLKYVRAAALSGRAVEYSDRKSVV